MSERNTGKIVSFTYDPENPPRLTPEQRRRLDELRPEEIDLSDIPEQSELHTWSRPGLTPKLLLLDDDVVELFKEIGGSAPERMNAVLREYAEAHRKSA